jgi:tetratricopeptide (TPR) repeat protein
MKYILYILTLFLGFSLHAQNAKQHIRDGNKQYSEKKYEAADASYKKALEKNNKATKADFNLGDALYKQKKYAEAIEQFQKFADKTDDKEAKANAYHNIGNANLESKK